MQHLLRNSIFTAIVLIVCVLAIIPPEKNLRLGKDLRGGSTLTYSVQIAQNEDEGEVISRVIDVLMDRVNPNGLYEISMVRQGRDRLEITMPMPSDRVKDLRDDFEASLERLRDIRITPSELDRALRLPASERGAALNDLANANAERRALLDAAATTWDAQHTVRDEYDALDATAADDVRDEVIARLAHAELQYESARDAALASTLDPTTVRQILSIDDRARKIYNEQSATFIDIPSPREAALQSLRDSYPIAVPDLEGVLDAFAAYERERTTLDDPQDLVRMLKGAGVLSFRIAVDANGSLTHPDEERLRRELQESGPTSISATDVRWFPLHKLDGWYRNWADYQAMQADPATYFEQYGGGNNDANFGYVVEAYNGIYYMLCWDTRTQRMVQGEGGEWSVSSAYPAQDQLGRPAVGFRMDATGAKLLRGLTAAHVNDAMAVLLDDRVYTAPNINEALSTTAIIQGEFTSSEIDYLMRTLSSGSLQAKLSSEPISVTTVGPDLGVDNLKRGLRAGIIALVAVSAFMVIYYFYFGGIAVVCLLCSAILILGAMALNRAAFTLPGIAGVILTFGMAVDANVLIYERIREELRKGKDLKISARIGYQKAMSSIVDGNVTNLIVCFVLGYTGTQEIKGFAITLGIGVVATLFSALVVARLLMVGLIERIGFRGWKQKDMLPMVVTPIEHLLE
ncbi:MAG: protein translocase subunit SecD, partial [Phycisphaerales bacterium]|nr:protein translocase subunit SecD [Phycisphaerales bacterium]